MRTNSATALILLALVGSAGGAPLVEGLAGSPDHVESAVAGIEVMPLTDPAWPSTMLAAGRACEDTLADPGRAAAIYRRIVADAPRSPEASVATVRIAAIAAHAGAGGEHDHEASDFSRLRDEADRLALDDVLARAATLANVDWPGAAEVDLWLAEWNRRHARFDLALLAYDDVVARFPGTDDADVAREGAAGAAVDAGAWAEAERRVAELPVGDDGDAILKADLRERIVRGRSRATWLVRCDWLVALVIAGLAASLIEASVRGGRRRPVLRPGAELVFLLPIASVLYVISLTTNQLIAPAVLVVSGGGIGLAWLSGAGLDTLRARGRGIRVRALAHAGACLVGVGALLYIALMREQLLDLVVETMKFGPGG